MTLPRELRGRPVHLVVRAWSTHGGTERYCHDFARWLRRHGAAPVVWCQEVDAAFDGVDVRTLPYTGRGRVGRMLATLAAVRRLEVSGLKVGFLRAPGFHVLRAGGGAHAVAMRALGAWGLADRVERAVDRAALRTAGVVVANSEMARDDICADVGRAACSVEVVRNGVDLESFCPGPAAERSRAVVFIGHGFARKGLAQAIEAMVHLPGVPLWVVGRDRRASQYRALATRRGVADRIHFLGAEDNPAAVLRRAGALVLPTRYDPSANVVLESMACGVPPVTTRTNGAWEVVPMPWLVVDDPDDVRSIAGALRRALAEPGLGARCRSAAERWSKERSHVQFARVLAAASQELS